MKRAELLEEARRLVCEDRNSQYGPPMQDFMRIAGILNILGYRAECGGREIFPRDVALIMISLKMSRLCWGPDKMDTVADIAGYAACYWECVSDQELQQQTASCSACQKEIC